MKRAREHSPRCASVSACDLLTGSAGSLNCGSVGWVGES